jgi:intracellular sulfur oxidation DsrE/DsrF family protein
MPGKKQYSDEHLNAFIDNQLDSIEKAELLDAVRHDAELDQRICKLQKLHNLVQLSYQSIDIPEHHSGKGKFTKPSRFNWFAAASLFIAIGITTGWLSHQFVSPARLSDIAEITHHPLAKHDSENWKLMLHVSTADPHRLNIVLNEAEALLKKYAKSPGKLELEILTNSDGLALVTNSDKAYNHQLKNLQKKYKNLAVMVCGETLKKIQKAQGKNLNLLPSTKIVPSAISQIISRQQAGWSYIRI